MKGPGGNRYPAACGGRVVQDAMSVEKYRPDNVDVRSISLRNGAYPFYSDRGEEPPHAIPQQ